MKDTTYRAIERHAASAARSATHAALADLSANERQELDRLTERRENLLSDLRDVNYALACMLQDMMREHYKRESGSVCLARS